MKLTIVYFAFALVCSTVLAADRDPSKDENSSNNTKPSILDFEITDEKLVQKGVLALMSNPWSLNFPSTIDINLLTDYLPTELILKTIFYAQHDYRRPAQTSKYFYHHTRLMHHHCMKLLLLHNSKQANTRFRRYFGYSSRNMVLKANIALYMTLLNDPIGNLVVWVDDILEAFRQNPATICSLLKAREPFKEIISPKLLVLLREAVVHDKSVLCSLVLQCSAVDDAMFTGKDLRAIVSGTSNNLTTEKHMVLFDLLLKRNDLCVEKKIISDSIHESLWSAISNVELANASIYEIAHWLNGLSDENRIIRQFKSDFISSLPWHLYIANFFAFCLNGKNTVIEGVTIADMENEHEEYYLLDEMFCKRNQFSENNCLDLFKQVDRMTLMETLIEKFDPNNEWSRRLMHRFAELFPIEDQKRSLDCLLLLGKPVEEFEGTLRPLVVAKMAAGLHPMCQYASAEQLRYIVKKFFEALVPHIGDPVAILMHLPFDINQKFMYMLTKTQIQLATHEAIATRRFDLFPNLLKNGDKSVFKILLAHVNQNPDFDCAETLPQLHIILVILSSNKEFRNKHLEEVRNKSPEDLSQTLKTSQYFLKRRREN